MPEVPEQTDHVPENMATSGGRNRARSPRWRLMFDAKVWGVVAVLAILMALSLRAFLRGQALDYFDHHNVTYKLEPNWCDPLLDKLGRFGDGFRSVSEISTLDTDENAIHLLGRFTEVKRLHIQGAIHPNVFPVLKHVETIAIESYESYETLLILKQLPNVSKIDFGIPGYSVHGTPDWAMPPEPLASKPPPSVRYQLNNLNELIWSGYSGEEVKVVIDRAPQLSRLEIHNPTIPRFTHGGVSIRFRDIDFVLNAPSVTTVEAEAFSGWILLRDCQYIESLAVDSLFACVQVGTPFPSIEEGLHEEIVCVGNCPRLRTAALSCGYMVIRLNDLPSLEHLVIFVGTNAKKTELALSLLATENIRAIDFEQLDGKERVALSVETFSQICTLPKLEYLNLSGVVLTQEQLQALQQISTLRSLRLPSDFGGTSVEKIDLIALRRDFPQPGIQIEEVASSATPSYWHALPFSLDFNSED